MRLPFWGRRREDRSTLGSPGGWLIETISGVDLTTGDTKWTMRTALAIPAVYAAIRLVSETVGSLPLLVYRRTDDGDREIDRGHPAFVLLHDQPNPKMTAMVFRETLQSHILGWGNAFAQIVRLRNGDVAQLIPIHPSRVRLHERLAADGSLIYVIDDDVLMPASEMLHVPGLSPDGCWGYSPLELFRETISLARNTEKFGGKFFEQGGKPSGVLTHPSKLSPEATQRLRESWQKLYSGTTNAHKIAVLEEGMKFEPITIKPEDAQFLDTRKFSVTDIARIFGVPPHMIGDLERATFSNVEQQSIQFVTNTIRPWLVRWEQEINRKIVGIDGPWFCEHKADGLLRGDTASRFTAYRTAIETGWMSRNEVRRMENLNTADGLDDFLQPLNYTPVGPDTNVIKEPPPPDDDENRSPWRDSMRIVLADVLRRMLRVEEDQATRASKRGDMMGWIERFYTSHEAKVAEAIEPAVRAALIAGGHDQSETERIAEDAARAHVARSTSMLASEPGIPSFTTFADAEADAILDAIENRFGGES